MSVTAPPIDAHAYYQTTLTVDPEKKNNHLHREHFQGGMLGRIRAPLRLACRSEQ